MPYFVYIKKLSLSGELRLGFDLNTCPEFAMQLQNIKGWLYSDILGIWHIPYYDNHLTYLQKKFGHRVIFYDLYPNHFKMQDSVGVINALDKALIAENGYSLFKINNAA